MKNDDANVIVNKQDAKDWIFRNLCQKNDVVYRHMMWAIGENLVPFEAFCTELNARDAFIAGPDVTDIHMRHPKNYRFLRFSPRQLPEQFYCDLVVVRDWIADALERRADWLLDTAEGCDQPKRLFDRFKRVVNRAKRDFAVLEILGNSQRLVTYDPQNADTFSLQGGGALSQQDVANILLFGCKGSFRMGLRVRRSETRFRLDEKLSGMETQWLYQDALETVNFSGWGFKHTGQGKLKPLLANRVAFFCLAGAHVMDSMFGYVGSYAFARAGFIPSLGSWMALRSDIKGRANHLLRWDNITRGSYDHVMSLCQSDDPALIWQIADIRDRVSQGVDFCSRELNVNTVGKALLCENSWHGRFVLNDDRQITRLGGFVGHDVLVASFDNACAVFKRNGLEVTLPVSVQLQKQPVTKLSGHNAERRPAMAG